MTTRGLSSRFGKPGVPAALVLAVLFTVVLPPSSRAEAGSSPQPPSKAFFEVPRTDSIAVFDFKTRRIIKKIDLGSEIRSLEKEPSPEPRGPYIYWSRHSGNDISVIDPTRYQVVGRIPLMELGPGNVKLAPDGHALYIPHYQAKALTIFDVKEEKQRVIPLPGFPGDIAVAPLGVLLVTSRDADQVLAVEESTGKTASVDVGRNPVGVAVTRDGSQAYVSHDTEATVSVIDLTKVPFQIAGRLKVGAAGGSAVAAGPDGKYVYVAHCCANSSLTVIDVRTMAVKCELSLAPKGLDPVRIIFSPDGGEAFVINSGSVNISSFKPPCGKPVAENLFD